MYLSSSFQVRRKTKYKLDVNPVTVGFIRFMLIVDDYVIPFERTMNEEKLPFLE